MIATARHNPVRRALRLLAIAIAAPGFVVSSRANAPAPLHLNGRYFEDAGGRRVVLRGCNLGNWLLLEPWMLGLRDERIHDDYDIVTTLARRFGAQRAEELLDVYRANWITAREFELVKSFGFNVVRLPFNHLLLASDADPFVLRDDAFEWLDAAVEFAEQAGVYVILDMHGAPGGQSVDMPSGRVDQNDLWTDETCQRRTAWLWQRIAERYRDRSAVVAYDLINEPWGDFHADVRSGLLKIVGRIHEAIREVDPDKLIYLPGTLRGITFYGDRRHNGWANCGLTEHYYPGLFGNGPPTLDTHARFLGAVLPGTQRLIERLDVPYLVGEFNVVHDSAAQPEMMRRYYDTFADSGWSATMWSLRKINPGGGVGRDNWCLTANAEPFTLPDLTTASDDGINRAFRELGTMPLDVDEDLRSALTARTPPRVVLAEYSAVTPPSNASSDIAGWQNTEIGDALRGGAVAGADDALMIWGAGSDIWADRDEFHFVHRPAVGDFVERGVLTELVAPSRYAKAGWMLRAGDAPDDAHVFVHAFPDGRVMLAWRPRKGEQTQERTLAISTPPVGLGVERTGERVFVTYTDGEGAWRREPAPAVAALAAGGLVGMVVGSHAELALASATFRSASAMRSASESRGTNLLDNSSFETAEGGTSVSDRAAHWSRWGDWFDRETDEVSTRDGDCVLTYHHDRITAANSSGTYQDVSGLRPGQTCTFSVYARADAPAYDKHGPQSVELRIESPDGERLLNVASRDYRGRDIAATGGWVRLTVSGTIPTENARVLIIVTPSEQSERVGAIRFDAAEFAAGDGSE